MERLLGDEYQDFLKGYDKPALHALRFNPLNKQGCESGHLRNALIDEWQLTPVPWCANGYYYNEDVIRPGKHAYHEAGLYYIQEASAMTPAEYLDVTPGDYCLDLCAAPGGKSTQIAGKLYGKGLLVSNEIVPNRAKILAENIERLGIANAIVTSEAPDGLSSKLPGFFDKIMVDAPCSGEGMFRKNDNAQDEWSPVNVKMCAERQDEILEHAAIMLAPGGRIVYSTCTFSPEENEGTIARFLMNHPEFELVPVQKHPGMRDGNPAWACSADGEPISCSAALTHTIRLFPHLIDGEGHFIAVLKHTGTPIARKFRISEKQLEKAVAPKKLPECTAFLEEAVPGLDMDGKSLVRFGDHINLLPAGTPSLKGIKVQRAGLELGELKKGRFEPAHALAKALAPAQVTRVVDVDLTQANAFISGLSLPCDGEKGWTLVTLEWLPIGWGKCAGGQLKNHYPKGLRKSL